MSRGEVWWDRDDEVDLAKVVEELDRRLKALENMVGANGVVVTRGPDGVTIAGPTQEIQALPDQLPPGDIEAQTLNWDDTHKVWYAGPARLM